MMRLNNHFRNQFDSNNCTLLPQDIKDSVLSDFEIMSDIGIDNDADQNKFFLIRNHVPEILFLIFKKRLNDKTIQQLSSEIFKNQTNAPINTILELIEATGLALNKMIPKEIIPKIAYPQPNCINQRPQYDIKRWVDATHNIYNMMNTKGLTSEDAKNFVINNWDAREKMDYEQWLNFYKEQVPQKYPKLAFDENIFSGGLPIGALKANINKKFPNPVITQVSKDIPGTPQHLPHSDVDSVRDSIETQRRKLVGRLNSAEKLLSSMEGQLFAGGDQELMLKLLQDLKRKIQIANKRTAKSTLFEDHIYKTANFLQKEGKNKAAGFFYKLAQLPSLDELGSSPVGGDSPMMEDSTTPPNTEKDPAVKQQTHDMLREFFDNLSRGIFDKNDSPEEREAIEAEDNNKEAFYNNDNILKLGSGYWTKTSQEMVRPQFPIPKAIQEPKQSVDIEETDADTITPDNTDDIIEAALRNVSVNDVMRRLEMLVSIYNQREISRQLAILDIMMDRIGLASFFPSLGEAMSKALEANQYIGNRLEEILTKLKGSVNVPKASEWIDIQEVTTPETEPIKQKLQQEEDEEEKRRQARRQKEMLKLENKPDTGKLPTRETAELQQPARVEKAPKIDVR